MRPREPLNRCRGCRSPIARNRVSCVDCWKRVPVEIQNQLHLSVGDAERSIAELNAAQWLRQNRSKQT